MHQEHSPVLTADIAYKIGRVLDRYYIKKYNDGYMLFIIGRKKK